MPRASMSTLLPRIIFLSPHDPNDVGTWSGTAYSIYHALLQSSGSVATVRASWTDWLLRRIVRMLQLAGITIDCTQSLIYARAAGMEASARVRFTPGDVIVAISATRYVFALKTSRPIIFMSDATLASISSIYSTFAEMPQWLREGAEEIERGAFQKGSREFLSVTGARLSAFVTSVVRPPAIPTFPLVPNIP